MAFEFNPFTGEMDKVGDKQTGAEIKALYEVESSAFTDLQFTKLAGIEAGAGGDQTGAEIKTLYEAETNAFTDAQFTKLGGIEALADITDAANVNAAGATMNADTTLVGNAYFLDEDTLVTDDPTKVASQQSIKAYVDTEIALAVAAEMTYKGGYNASTNTPDLDTAPSGVAKGDMYTVSVAGTFFTVAVEAGDVLIAEIVGASVEADWTIANRNLDAATTTIAGIVELAIVSEINTGTDNLRAITSLGLKGSDLQLKVDGIEAAADVTDYTNIIAALAAPSATLVFNESGGNFDVRFEGVSNTHLVFLDASANRIGFSNLSLLPTDGLVHIQSGTAGSVTAFSDANLGVFESAFDGGISILNPATRIGYIAFGSPTLNTRGLISFNHSTDIFNISSGGFDQIHISISTGVTLNEAGLAAMDFRVESDISTHAFFVDAGNNRIGFSNVSLLPTDGLVHIQKGSAGAVSAASSTDVIVLESAGDSGLTILSGITSIGTIAWGDTTSNFRASIRHFHNGNTLNFFTGSGVTNTNISLSATETVINEQGIATIDFRVESDNQPHMLFVDAGTENVLINGSVSATTAVGHLHIGTGTSPTAVLANGIVLGSKDSGVGSLLAIPELWIENPPEVIGTFTPSHKFKTWINGTEYFIQLDAA